MDEIHVHKTKKSICAHFAESPCRFFGPPQAKVREKKVFSLIRSLLLLFFSQNCSDL